MMGEPNIIWCRSTTVSYTTYKEKNYGRIREVIASIKKLWYWLKSFGEVETG
jgi:hypothetical protein